MRSDFLFWAAARVARGTVVESILATPADVVDRASAPERERVERMVNGILPVSVRRPGLLNDAAVTSALPRYELERIAAPTLAISVEDDRFGTYDSARYTAAHIPGARFIGYPSGGHVWVGHQADVETAIAEFLQERASAH